MTFEQEDSIFLVGGGIARAGGLDFF